MNTASQIENLLKEYPEYQEKLFIKGYLITNQKQNLLDYPFCGNWHELACGLLHDKSKLYIYYHKQQNCYIYEERSIIVSIIGHAYNPFDMKYKEMDILQGLANAYMDSECAFVDKINELTGIYLVVLNDNGNLIVLQDCGGMKSCYYGLINNTMCITSHPQLVGDIYNLQVDSNICGLMQKWFFSLGGRYLPGDLSPYKQLRRLGPNTLIKYRGTFQLQRFYPTKEHPEISEEKYEETIRRIATLIHNNIKLCTLKWDTPAISLSGGMDSKTTLACANGLYDKYKYYSFHCKPQEVEDANAAHNICRGIGVEHTIYPIPDDNKDIKDFNVLKKIIHHNASYIATPKDHEVRKFIYLSRLDDFDVELKSWISEVGRAMWQKKYGINLPSTLTARHFSIFQTRYLGSPKLLKHADDNYKDYLKRINLETPLFNFEHTDSFYWEFRFGSWGGNVVTAQDIFNFTVTMPINNRKIIEMFLWFPHEYRKQDMVNKEIIKAWNDKIYKLNLNVHNVYLRGKRVFMEKAYYYYRTLFYWHKAR